MTTLRVILDDMLAPRPSALARYTADLASALIDHAPRDCTVEGFVSSSPESDYARIAGILPGLDGLTKSSLTHAQLSTAWQHGFTRMAHGMLHSPSLFAPLFRHDTVNEPRLQIAVTIPDTLAWSAPELLSVREVSRARAMATRAYKYADAVVVSCHAVASELQDILPFGERIRVVEAAVSPALTVPPDADSRAQRLELPEQYVLAFQTPANDLKALLSAMARPEFNDFSAVVVGSRDTSGETTESFSTRVRFIGDVSDEDLCTLYRHAKVLAIPAMADKPSLTMLEAFHFGVPVVHSDLPSLVELAGNAGLAVARTSDDRFVLQLADALGRVLGDSDTANELAVLGEDRAKVFTWRSAAEKVWELHASL